MGEALGKILLNRQTLILLPALLLVAWLLAGYPSTPWHDDPILDSRATIGIIAVALILMTVISPTYRPITATQRMVLSGLRLGVVVIVVVFMLQPTCISVEMTKQSASLLVLFDQSRSMTLPHTSESKTRWQAQLETLRASESLLADMPENLNVKLFGYDTDLHPVKFEDGKIEFPEAANGDLTDLGTPLDDAIKKEQSNRMVGVILLGDGVQTAAGVSAPWEVVEELARLDQPLYTVAYGPTGSATQSRDIAVVNLPDQYSVFVKNELLVQGTLQLRGFENVEVPVELIVEDSKGKEEVVDTVRVKPNKANQQTNVELSYSPQETGQFRVTLRAVPQEKETVVKNNELSAFLTVFGGGLRVLYLEGDLRMEQKFLRRSLDASQDIEVDFQWIDHRLRARWPVDLKDTFSNPLYDVFIVGDLDSRALFEKGKREESLNALVKAVEDGKGLLMLGGFHSFGPGRYGQTPLADVLPIEIDRLEAQDFEKPIIHDLHVSRKLQMKPTTPFFVTRLAESSENDRAWRELPPLDGANKFKDVKDRAIVRIESEDGVPLLVSSEYGGRILAFAGDSTWRWWMQGHDARHRRFWRQVILWLAKRDELEKDDVWIRLSQRRFDPGSRVEFKAGAKSGAGDLITDAKFESVVVFPDGKRKPIPLTRREDEHEGNFTETKQPGTYTVEVTAKRGTKVLGTARAKFMVYDHDVELSIAEANHDQLARLARQTKGRMVAPEELSDLLREIKKRPLQLDIEIPKKWQLGDTWQDAWLFFLCVVSLLTVEWILRKKWGLV